MRSRNVIGRTVSRLRYERNWTQDILVARLQCEGVDISRQMLARIELGHTKVSDAILIGLHRVFRIPIVRFFPQEVQILDERFAGNTARVLKTHSRHAKG